MTDPPARLRASLELALDATAAFDVLVDELASALDRLELRFDRHAGGVVAEGSRGIGRVVSWKTGERVSLEWRADWNQPEVLTVDLRVERLGDRTKITVEHQGWAGLIGEPDELVGWFAGTVAAPLLAATMPRAIGDWITDRRARRPSGARSREIYRDPLYHYPNFRVILAELALTPDDFLLEVGCGGGALLKIALERGCRAAAVDHSPEMVRLAQEVNAEAVTAGRLSVREAHADALPFPDATFTCATMTGVLGFLTDPVAVIGEIRRVLAPGGRFVSLGSNPRLRGTPGAPEPMASRLRFYERHELEALARGAGFEEVRVVSRDLEGFAREAGVPEEHLPLFAGGDDFLIARRR